MESLIVSGVPIVAVVMGLVEYVKKLGVKGNALSIVSMMIGVALGVLAYVAANGAPADFAGWFSASVYGLVLGLTASGVYDLFDKRFPVLK